jgi:hypothetical protein
MSEIRVVAALVIAFWLVLFAFARVLHFPMGFPP